MLSFDKPLTPSALVPEYQNLIERIYKTVMDPSAWMPLLHDLVAATSSKSARLLVMNAKASAVNYNIKINLDDDHHRQHIDCCINKCPWRPGLRRTPAGRLYSTHLDFICRQPEFPQTAFYNEWAQRLDIHHALCGTIYQDSCQTVHLLIKRSPDQGYYSEAEINFVNHLVPHMQHTFLIAGKIADTHARSEAIAISAERKDLPFLLLDPSLRMIYCSPGAKRMIEEQGLLRIKRGMLFVADEFQNRRLHRLLRDFRAATENRQFHAGGGNISLSRADGTNLQLLIRPIHPEVPFFMDQIGTYAAIYLYEAEAHIEIDPDCLRRLYALSKAEARVAIAMVNTPDSEDVAGRCGISLHTLRSHLKSIFSKTQTHSRAELMKYLLTGPARRR